MVICEEKKWIFIRNPKTASKSITKYLIENFNCFDNNKYHSTIVPNEYKEFTAFICVRNPLSRAVSAWLHVARNVEINLEQFILNQSIISVPIDPDLSEENLFFQSDIIERINCKNIKLLYFEKIEKNIIKNFKKDAKLEKLGANPYSKKWMEYYEKVNIDYYKIFQKDFDKIKIYNKIFL